VQVEQSGEGYVVHYAIADLGAFVTPGGALDMEVRKRGMTVYGPDARTPLHPKILSEGAASLLPEEDRPAVLWTVTLDARGIITGASLERVLVRSRERLTYAEVQSALDAGTASESLQLLADVGRLRQSLEAARGGVSLEVPEQEVERREDGTYTLSFRRNLPVEEWNAQISLLTGIAAAHLMRESASCAPSPRPSPATSPACTAPPVRSGSTGRTTSRTRASFRRSSRGSRSTRRSSTRRRPCSVVPVTSRSACRGPTAPLSRPPRTPATPPSPPTTRTSPRRCGAWWTATRRRSASRSPPEPPSHGGCSTPCRTCPP
jgi:hypothetical protein